MNTPDLPRLACPRTDTHEGHTWPVMPRPGGRVYWCGGITTVPLDAGDHATKFPHGSSEAYPSHAAAYGVESLMAMAGSLTERDEWDHHATIDGQATGSLYHLREAQRLAAVVENTVQGQHMAVADTVALAQVHATVALASQALTNDAAQALAYAVLALTQAVRDLPVAAVAAVDEAEAAAGE